jgi:hypothetical protein
MRTLFYSTLFIAESFMAQVPAGAIGYWPFDGNANDHSGNGSHGTFTNTIPAHDRFNQPNKAFKFNGTGKVVVQHNAIIDVANTDFTFALWQKTYPGNFTAAVAIKHKYGSWSGYNFVANNQTDPGYCTTTNHQLWYVAAGAQQDACSNGPVLADTSWHLFVGMFDATQNRSYMYIDNVLQSDIGSRSGVVSNTANLCFGFLESRNSNFFKGVLDGARLYNRMLTASELTGLYKEGGFVPTSVNDVHDSSKGISVYPNPSSGEFTMNIKGAETGMRYRIVNQLGEIIRDETVKGDDMILVTGLDTGIYFVCLNGHSVHSKVIVTK